MNIEKFENRVENIDLDNITQDDVDLIKEIIQKLDNGEIRVVEKIDNEWVVNEWVKKSISFYFWLGSYEKNQLFFTFG